MLESIAELDVKTLMVVLFWGNLVSVVLILVYYCTGNNDSRIGVHYLPAKAIQAVAYMLLMSREQIPDILSVNLGNTALMVGFYLEALTMLAIVQELRSSLTPLTVVTIVCVIGFTVSEYYSPDGSVRVAIASMCVFFIFFLPNIRLLVSLNTSLFKRAVGVYYMVFLIILLPRTYLALTQDMNILTNSVVQTLTFMSLVLLLIFSLPAYLLLMKEDTDRMMNVMATTDYLTRLSNRYRFLEAAERSFERCRFDGASAAVLFFDIDHFKDINDTYGHVFGDAVLVALGRIVRESVRPTDLCCRYGGEEFVILLPDATNATAHKVAERIRNAIVAERFEEHPEFRFTISIGVADGIPQPGDSLELYVGHADAAMYSAKKAGRNQIMEYTPGINCPVPTSQA